MLTIEHNAVKIPVLETGLGRLFVNKPAGLSVHNNSGEDLCSIVNAYLDENPQVRKRTVGDAQFGVNPVHRLDKETSGVILLAVTREMLRFYSEQFASRNVKKRYVAVVHGILENAREDGGDGVWSWPLSKKAGGRSNPGGSGKRLSSETHYRVLGHSSHYTMLRVEIHSGRTHQIRRHAKLAGHPVVGDARYGSTRAINYVRDNFKFNRLALHACSLTLRTIPGNAPQTIAIENVPKTIMSMFENDKISIAMVDPRTPEISSMIADLDVYQATLYPPESNHLVDVAKLAGAEYYFIGAFDLDRPVAIASFKRVSEAYVEIKRLYVPKEYRGRKLAKRLMNVLEKKAISEGVAEARLETGIHQHEAIALYEKRGYEKIESFGSYKKDPLSVFMRKKL